MIRCPEHDKIKIHTIDSEEGFKFSVQLTSKDLLQNGRHRSKAGTRACHWSLVIPSPCSSIFALAHSSICVLFLEMQANQMQTSVSWKTTWLHNYFFEGIPDRYESVCAQAQPNTHHNIGVSTCFIDSEQSSSSY